MCAAGGQEVPERELLRRMRRMSDTDMRLLCAEFAIDFLALEGDAPAARAMDAHQKLLAADDPTTVRDALEYLRGRAPRASISRARADAPVPGAQPPPLPTGRADVPAAPMGLRPPAAPTEPPWPPKRILFVSASPAGRPEIEATGEYEALARCHLASRGGTELLPPRFGVSFDTLRETLWGHRDRGTPPDLIHFAGHGTDDGVVLQDTGGGQEWVSIDGIAGLLEELARDSGPWVSYVVITACHAGPSASRLLGTDDRGRTRHGIAAKGRLPDGAGIKLSGALYGRMLRPPAPPATFLRCAQDACRDGESLYGGGQFVIF